jgi:hypothetical protein
LAQEDIMVYTGNPTYLRLHGRAYYLKLPIPADVRHHFLREDGKPKAHIVEPLGTRDAREAEKRKKAALGRWWQEFERLRKADIPDPQPKLAKARERLQDIREAIEEAHKRGDDELASTLEMVATDVAEALAEEQGVTEDDARTVYLSSMRPGTLTLRKALEKMHADSDMKASTKVKHLNALNELLDTMGRQDALPGDVREAVAVRYVDALNATQLSKQTKQGRLSSLGALWSYLIQRRQVPRTAANLWSNHAISQGPRVDARNGDTKRRPFTDAELERLFNVPPPVGDRGPKIEYAHPLMLEVYTLGMTIGARIDELCSIRVVDCEEATEEVEPSGSAEGRLRTSAEGLRGKACVWISFPRSKTASTERTIPTVHPAAVAILTRRLQQARTGGHEYLFHELVPGGIDGKRSWGLSKAMGRHRRAIRLPASVVFHSTRHALMTVLENHCPPGLLPHAQRYVAHAVPTLMHTVYSAGPAREALLRVAGAIQYGDKVEHLLREAAGIS